MARKVETTLVDDMTGDAADETVRFSLDGVEFEIDLSANNAGVLRDILADYANAGRKVGKPAAVSKAVASGVTRSSMRIHATPLAVRNVSLDSPGLSANAARTTRGSNPRPDTYPSVCESGPLSMSPP